MTTSTHDYWRVAQADDWRWPNFRPAEIGC
jgi:hypothetical protein